MRAIDIAKEQFSTSCEAWLNRVDDVQRYNVHMKDTKAGRHDPLGQELSRPFKYSPVNNNALLPIPHLPPLLFNNNSQDMELELEGSTKNLTLEEDTNKIPLPPPLISPVPTKRQKLEHTTKLSPPTMPDLVARMPQKNSVPAVSDKISQGINHKASSDGSESVCQHCVNKEIDFVCEYCVNRDIETAQTLTTMNGDKSFAVRNI